MRIGASFLLLRLTSHYRWEPKKANRGQTPNSTDPATWSPSPSSSGS